MGGFAVGGLALCLLATSCSARSDDDLVVFGAASLTDVLQAAEEQFEQDNPGIDVVLNLGGSNALREQIRSGADADLFIPADPEIMAEAIAAGDVDGPETAIARNELAIAVPAGNPADVQSLSDFARPELLLGICASAVPCGQLARAAFATSDIDPSLDTEEPDVRSLLAKVAGGELDAGVVYISDVAADPRVELVALKAWEQQSTTYVIAPTSGATNAAAAKRFVDFLQQGEGRSIIQQFGFGSVSR